MLLRRHGRREGMRRIFASIQNFIKNSGRTNVRAFHETLTYFWVHMVHYAIVTDQHLHGGRMEGMPNRAHICGTMLDHMCILCSSRLCTQRPLVPHPRGSDTRPPISPRFSSRTRPCRMVCFGSTISRTRT